MKYIKLFEQYTSSDVLYHFTDINSIKSILTDGFIKGYAGSIYDEEDGETISTTRDSEYHTKGHDIEGQCRIRLDGSKIRQVYSVYNEVDYGYEEMKKKELISNGMSEETAKEMASEQQEVIMTDSLSVDYILGVDFFSAPDADLKELLVKKNIPFNF